MRKLVDNLCMSGLRASAGHHETPGVVEADDRERPHARRHGDMASDPAAVAADRVRAHARDLKQTVAGPSRRDLGVRCAPAASDR